MPDEAHPPERPPELIALGVAGLLESLRDDVREDISGLRTELGHVEQRVSARVEAVDAAQKETRGLIERFANGHAKDHEAEAEDRRAAHGTFYEFIRAAELDKARREGALGVMRYTIELLSKHAPKLVALILAVAGAVGVATGSVNVSVGE